MSKVVEDRFQRRLAREKAARMEAENLLEEKSLELYETNQELLKLSESLASQVKERTAELEQLRDEAVEILEEKTKFFAQINHELRTPLTGLLGMLDIMAADTLGSEQSRRLSVAKQSGDNLLALINDVLARTRLDGRHEKINLISALPGDLIKSCIESLRPLADKKHLDFVAEVQTSLFENHFHIDALKVRQVITNLLGNAIKFTEEGGVKISANLSDHTLTVLVEDSGSGIAPEDQARIFEPFAQAGDHNIAGVQGTGLGLSIAYEQTALMDGELSLERSSESGSTFKMQLPLTHSNEIDKQSDNKPQQSFPGHHCLVAEDNEVNQEVISFYLGKLDLTCDIVPNGKEAVEKASASNYDIIILDLNMPVLRGEEAAVQIRSSGNNTPIIALTAQDEDYAKVAVESSGMNALLEKPIVFDRLAQTLAGCLRIETQATPEEPVHESTSAAEACIDLDTLLADFENDQDIVDTLFALFKENLADQVAEINRSFDNKDRKAVADTMHAMKGASASMRANTLSQLAAQAQAHFLNADSQRDSDIIEAIQAEVDRVNAFLEGA